jgi:hypothetical protein
LFFLQKTLFPLFLLPPPAPHLLSLGDFGDGAISLNPRKQEQGAPQRVMVKLPNNKFDYHLRHIVAIKKY